jgi:hypothetical protein
MYLKQEFLADLQKMVDEGEYIVDRNELCDAIVYDHKLLFDDHIVLFDAESIKQSFTSQYFVMRVNDHFTLLTVAFSHKDPFTLEITEFSHFPLYSDAMQRMLDIENTDF